MPSFDVVCKTDMVELDNAVAGVGREVKQRYDLKGTMCSIERSGQKITITADNDLLLRQMHQALETYCTRRNVDFSVLQYMPPQDATKGSLRQEVNVREGIDDTTCRQIIKAVKGAKLKVQVSIQGDELRVSGKNRDDLQGTIGFIKEMKIEIPLQYINFRD